MAARMRQQCAVEGCLVAASRWGRCRRHSAPPEVIDRTLDVYETEGLNAAARAAGIATTTVLTWAKQQGRGSVVQRRDDPAFGLTGAETARAAGITYRQLDYWTREGYITAKVADPGSGVFRRYLPEQVEQVRVLARLTRIGLPVGRVAALPPDDRARLVKVLEAEGITPAEDQP